MANINPQKAIFSVLALFLLLSSVGHADEYTFDTIFKEATTAKQNKNIVLATEKFKQSKFIAFKNAYSKRELDSIISLLEIFDAQHKQNEIKALLSRLENLSVKLYDPLDQVRCYRILAIFYQKFSRDELARDYFSVAVEYARELDDQYIKTILLNELGNADAKVDDLYAALSSFNESYTIAKTIGDNESMINAIINVVQVKIELRELDGLEDSLDLIDALIEKNNTSHNYNLQLIKTGDLYYQLFKNANNKNDYLLKAFNYYSKAKTLGKKFQSPTLQAIANLKLSALYLAENRKKEAEQLLDLSIKGFKASNSVTYLRKAYAIKATLAPNSKNL